MQRVCHSKHSVWVERREGHTRRNQEGRTNIRATLSSDFGKDTTLFLSENAETKLNLQWSLARF